MHAANSQLAALGDRAESSRFNTRTCSCLAQVLNAAANQLNQIGDKHIKQNQYAFFKTVNDVRKWMDLNSRPGSKRVPRKALHNMWKKVNDSLCQVGASIQTPISTASFSIVEEYWEMDVMEQMDMRDKICVVLWVEQDAKLATPQSEADSENFIHRFDVDNVAVFRIKSSKLQDKLEMYESRLQASKFDGRIRIVLSVTDPVSVLKQILATGFLRHVPVMVNTSKIDCPEDVIYELCRLKSDIHVSIKPSDFDKFCGFATLLWINYKEDPARTIVEKRVSKTGVVVHKTDSIDKGLRYLDTHCHLGYLEEFRIVVGDGTLKLDEEVEASLNANKKKEFFSQRGAAQRRGGATGKNKTEEEFSTLELVQILRNRLKWHTPILVFSYGNDTLDPELYTFKSLKITTDLTILEYFATMKALPWAVDLAAYRGEINSSLAGTLKIINLRCNDLIPKKAGATLDPYVVIKIGDSFEKKTKKITGTLNPTWNLGWEMNCKLSDKISIQILEKSMFGKHEIGGHFEGLVSDLIPVATPFVEVTKAIETPSKSSKQSLSSSNGTSEKNPSNPTTTAPPCTLTIDVGFKHVGQSERTLGKHFGQSLEESMSVCIRDGTPHIIEKCVASLMANGLETEGIFRQASNPKRVETLKDNFDKGLDVNLDGEDPHDVGMLLRTYLRELPEPLIPRSHYASFKQIKDTEKRRERLSLIGSILEKLPPYNLECFAMILHVLHEIGKNEAINKMPARNLASILGTALAIPKDVEADPSTYLADTTAVTTVLESCIIYSTKLFSSADKKKKRGSVSSDGHSSSKHNRSTPFIDPALTETLTKSMITPRRTPKGDGSGTDTTKASEIDLADLYAEWLIPNFVLKESHYDAVALQNFVDGIERDPYAPIPELGEECEVSATANMEQDSDNLSISEENDLPDAPSDPKEVSDGDEENDSE